MQSSFFGHSHWVNFFGQSCLTFSTILLVQDQVDGASVPIVEETNSRDLDNSGGNGSNAANTDGSGPIPEWDFPKDNALDFGLPDFWLFASRNSSDPGR